MKRIYITLIPLLISFAAVAEDLKDPMTRDEDISGTKVTVDYSRRPDGLYSYKYTVVSPATNLGTIGEFEVALACDKSFSNYTLPPPSASRYYSPPVVSGGYIPSMIYASEDEAFDFGVSGYRSAMWAIFESPGGNRTTLEIVSPAEPGWRTYTLSPHMETEGWAYTDPPAPGTPWIDTFMVFGIIPGPGCPGVTPPVELPSFDGSAWPNEAGDTNKLLTYKAPLVSHWHADADATSFEMEIVYAADVDPETFRVTPGWLRPYFDPQPGTSQKITIPLKQAKNIIGLRIGSTKEPPKHRGYHVTNTYEDRDVFEIRRDVVTKGRKGQ